VVCTENAVEPVVVEGTAEVVTDPEALARLLALENAKYQTDYSIELLDPAVNATIRVRPGWAFGLAEADFTGSPRRTQSAGRGHPSPPSGPATSAAAA
jgi:hypothetical protein